jgi:hypothetical protein
VRFSGGRRERLHAAFASAVATLAGGGACGHGACATRIALYRRPPQPCRHAHTSFQPPRR